MKIVKNFCESTSLHGYSYMLIGDSIALKILWTFVILAMTTLGVAFLAINTSNYMNATIFTTTETSSDSLNVSTYK